MDLSRTKSYRKQPCVDPDSKISLITKSLNDLNLHTIGSEINAPRCLERQKRAIIVNWNLHPCVITRFFEKCKANDNILKTLLYIN